MRPEDSNPHDIDAGKTLVSGSFWITLSEVAQGGAEIAATIVAAQILAPDDFGLMGIAMLVVATLQAFSHTGFDQAIVQAEDDVQPLLNVAFTFQFGRGVLLAGLLVVLAPFMAGWYERPILEPMLYAIAGYTLILGIQNVGILHFQRDLNFRTIFVINSIKALAHVGVAIPAILYFENVWGLVVGTIAGAAASTMVSYLAHPFRPRFEWDGVKAKRLIKYGKWMTGMAMIGFAVTQGDDFFVSGFLGVAALGYYQMAYNVSNLPATKITHVISKVSFPTYARLQSDPLALKGAFLAVMRTTVLLSAALSVVIWFLVDELVEFVISEKWDPIIVLVRILVISAFIRSVAALGGALFQAVGRPDLDFKMNLSRFFVILIGIYPAAKFYGLEGVCWLLVGALASCGFGWWYGVRKYANVTVKDLVRATGLPVANAAVLAGSLLLAEALVPASNYKFAVSPIFGTVVWLVVMLILSRVPSLNVFADLKTLKQKLRP